MLSYLKKLASSPFNIAIALFTLALLARVVLFAFNFHANEYHLINTIHGDDGYYELSANVLGGHGFTDYPADPPRQNPLRTPLYPYAIAAILFITGSYWAVLAIQIIVGSLSATLAFFVGERLTGSRWAGAVVGAVIALEPYHMLFSTIFYTETLFIFLFLSFVLLFFRYLEEPTWQRLVLASVLLGIATLTKTTVQFMPILLAGLIIWDNRHSLSRALGHTAILCGVFLLIISPWLYRNYQTFGVIGMTAQPAFNMIVYLAPSVISLSEGTPLDQNAFMQERSINPEDITLATAPFYIKQAREIIAAHPVGLIKVGVVSAVTFFTHDGMHTVLQHAGYIPGLTLSRPALVLLIESPVGLMKELHTQLTTPYGLIVLFRVLNIVATILFFVGAVLFFVRRRYSMAHIAALLFVAYFLATTVVNGLGVNARFRMPVEPLILSFASLSVIAVLENRQHTRKIV